MTCECDWRLCECAPVGDVREDVPWSIHFRNAMSTLATWPNYERHSTYTPVKPLGLPFNPPEPVRTATEPELVEELAAKFADLEGKRRKLEISQGRSPHHGPPCPPTPIRSDLRSVNALDAVLARWRPRTGR